VSYASLLTPRREVLNDQIDGIIDLANINRRGRLENKPQEFFDLTFPAADVKRVVAEINARFSTARPSPGLFLFEGLKGSGKSHLLLLVYHLLSSPRQAQEWLSRHGLQCALHAGAAVVLNKFTDAPLYAGNSIWDLIFREIGVARQQSFAQPGLGEMESALAGRKLILILDELEQGIRSIANEAVRAQNIAFLQMLSEWGNRSNQLTVFASIYSSQQEPGDTLKRVPRCEVQFKQVEDRAKVVLHRLFDNFLDFEQAAAAIALPDRTLHAGKW